jgi:uncharacterized protein (TIGR04222 family)
MTLPWNPFDWPGPAFLALYAALSAAAFAAVLVWRHLIDISDRASGRAAAPGLGMLELAYLAGGAERACDAAVVALLQQDAVRLEKDGQRLVAGPDQPGLSSVLCGFRDAAVAGRSRSRLIRTAAAALAPVRRVLEARGLIWSRTARSRLLWPSALLLLGLYLFAAVKIVVGLERGRAIGFLVTLVIVDLFISIFLLVRLGQRTRAGAAALGEWAGERNRLNRAPRGRELALAVALAGPAVLAGTSFAAYGAVGGGGSDGCGGDGGGGGGDSGGGSGGCGGCGGS